ncbi:glycerol kinase GlpK [Sinomicrobium weinanense]|uniref:Glycerol kinase n=1 Tax=Sinomicrobium weinanense TaxID=2842200 RepID=A0A926JPX2_9FLAO|nr:glycerol kinase GlpK [Sinomicrobium weinanense]MBC9795305.1 glycerol kinase GlpK [Sinomicrobium weinanense]MBU3125777.1 glycerol kinase GlpK [Sinomicrobium weinanense]
MKQYILALDQGTTSSRAILFDEKGQIVSVAQKEFTQIFPKPGWVEHNALEIWSTQAGVAAEAVTKIGLNGKSIAAMGITNQRETVIVWDRNTGIPIYNAIVWQDRRTAAYCAELKKQGKEELIRNKTGLIIDSYFSATKVKWILDNVPGAREKAEAGELVCGTVDSWIIWNFTKGELHITDVTNASRTLLFNIHTMEWDDELLELFTIPKSILPEVKQSSEVYGHSKTTVFATPIPIAGIGGDQQAALFGQMCIDPGMVKNTYGTGCFMLMNIGDKPKLSENNLLTTVAWKINGKTQYALEGSIFIAGAVVQWLRDGLKFIRSSDEVEQLASQVEDTDGVYFVPAFAGLGAPYWNSDARGTMVGLTRGTTAAHIARAALESIAYQTADVLRAMQADAGIEIRELRVDGGAAVNDLLMQFQSDLLKCNVIRPNVVETTALGAAYLAGLATGYWKDMEEIQQLWQAEKEFTPDPDHNMEEGIAGWKRAIKATQSHSM